MVFVNTDLDGMLEQVDLIDIFFDEAWVPFDHPERHMRIMRPGGWYLGPNPTFSFEMISGVTKPKTQHVYALETAVSLAIENALMRGHKGDNLLPLSVQVYAGKKGPVVRVEDSGPGFPFKEYIAMREEGDFSYRQGKGRGLSQFSMPSFQVSFENGGNVVNIMSLYEEFDE